MVFVEKVGAGKTVVFEGIGKMVELEAVGIVVGKELIAVLGLLLVISLVNDNIVMTELLPDPGYKHQTHTSS